MSETNQTAVAQREATPAEIGKRKLNDLRALFESMAPQLQTALPRHMKADRLARIALTACHRTPALLDCTPKSFAAALMTSAQIGLEPDGVVGQAYLIPRKNNGVKEVCLQVGYKGLLELAQRSGRIASVSVRVVHDGDEFRYSYGLDDELMHRPTGDPDGPVTHVYAVVRTNDGGRYVEVMTRAQVESHRRRFAKDSRPDSAWVTAWEWMAKKTVLIQALKLAPKSVELATAVSVDEEPDTQVPADVAVLDMSSDAAPAEAPKGLAGLTAKATAAAPMPAPQVIAASAGTAGNGPILTQQDVAREDPAPKPRGAKAAPDQARITELVRQLDGLATKVGRDVMVRLCEEAGGSLGAKQYGLASVVDLETLLGMCEWALERA